MDSELFISSKLPLCEIIKVEIRNIAINITGSIIINDIFWYIKNIYTKTKSSDLIVLGKEAEYEPLSRAAYFKRKQKKKK